MKRFLRKHILPQLLLPLLFLWHIGSITLFTHTHVVNGKKIVHSHPYTSRHSHTDNQFKTISLLSFCKITDCFPQICLPDEISVPSDFVPALSIINKKHPEYLHSVISRRGPPSGAA